MFADRVLSGMRPTGSLHLGHYHGVLKNWVQMQHEYECLFFVADWHALTTHYDTPQIIEHNVWDMVVDCLAAGINPADNSFRASREQSSAIGQIRQGQHRLAMVSDDAHHATISGLPDSHRMIPARRGH